VPLPRRGTDCRDRAVGRSQPTFQHSRRCTAGRESHASGSVPTATVLKTAADDDVDPGVCQATLFRSKRQALIDAGVIEGIPATATSRWSIAAAKVVIGQRDCITPDPTCPIV
jgi:hypothetical protein